MKFKSLTPKEEFFVDNLYSIHYFEYMSNFQFEGEAHPFWEFVCVDKGEVNVMADNRSLVLHKNEIIFHKPDEFHNIGANGVTAPNLVVISFSSPSPHMSFFENKILTISEIERNLLGSIILEARNAFQGPLDDPYYNELVRRQHQLPGSEQIIRLRLEELLIQLYRRYTQRFTAAPVMKSVKKKGDEETYNHIINYLEAHIQARLSTEQICRDNLIGLSQLQKLFRDRHSCGVIDYFTKMKITAAKQLIRDQHMNFTQIADVLGYSSIHYFSRMFKKITGMTPSDYASSIKLLAEKPDKD